MSKLDAILKLAKDNDGEYYVAADKSYVHEEQERRLKDLIKELGREIYEEGGMSNYVFGGFNKKVDEL